MWNDRWRAIVFGAACLLTAIGQTTAACAAMGQEYIEAYNVLVRMLNDRQSAANREPYPLKSAEEGDSVTQQDLNFLRARSVDLMSSAYLVGPDCAEPTCFDDLEAAFPKGLRFDANGNLIEPSLMTSGGFEIGKNGRFTKIPPEYHGGGQGIYANSFTDAPLLWVHFLELHEAFLRMRCTRRTGFWETECRAWGGTFVDNDWGDIEAAVDGAIMADSNLVVADTLPRNTTCGTMSESQWKWQEWSHAVDARLYRGRCVVDNLAAVGMPNCTFFYFAVKEGDVWGTTGNIMQNRWAAWCSISGEGGVARSQPLGDSALSWCAAPAEIGDRRSQGHQVSGMIAVIDWSGLFAEPIENPELYDMEEDGLVAKGCECTSCPPGEDPEFRKMCAHPVSTFPLGLSSGLAVGNLRVKAYIHEYEDNGSIGQMFSLDTHVVESSIVENTEEQWGFASVKRPTGVDVMFSLCGTRSGFPVNTQNRYRLVRAEDRFELRFPQRGQVVHAFGVDGHLCEVRATVEHHEVAISGSAGGWPGMDIVRDSTGLLAVETAILKAYPQYSGGLVTAVEYRDSNDQPIRHLSSDDGNHVSGAAKSVAESKEGALSLHKDDVAITASPSDVLRERRFVARNGAGHVLKESRVVHAPNSVEIWSGISTNDGFRVLKKDMLRQTYSPEMNRTTRVRTTVIDQDGFSTSTRVSATVIGRWPWGSDIVSEITGYGTAAAQTRLYEYYNDEDDGSNYGRLKSVLEPDGWWQRFEYDFEGRVVRIVGPFKNSPPNAPAEICRETLYHYAGDSILTEAGFPVGDCTTYPDHRPRLMVERVLGYEVSRTYDAYLPTMRVTKQCAVPGARYDDAGNQVRTVCVYTNGLEQGRLRSIHTPDGNLTTFSYAFDEELQCVTCTASRGWSGSGERITAGTVTVSQKDSGGRLLYNRQVDIESGLLLSDVSHVLDAFGRSVMMTNAVSGRFEARQYGCCGPERVTAQDGTITYRILNGIDQVISETTRGVTVSRTYDAWGNISAAAQIAPGASAIRTAWSHDPAGRLVCATDALGHETTYQYGVNAGGGELVTTIYPDGGSRVDAVYRDGRPHMVSGTAVPPVCWDYGVDGSGAYSIEYKGGNTNVAQWTRSCFDMLGRVSHTVTAGGYTNRFAYDLYGREVCQDDGFAMRLTEYNDAGEAFRTAIDMNRNGVIDLDGPDRVQEAASAYTNWDGRLVHASTVRAYCESGSDTPTTVAQSYTALDGTEAWSVSFGRTNRQITALDPACVSRRETRILPDGTSRVSLYTNNLLMVQAGVDCDGNVISTREYNYDSLGRLIEMREPAAGGRIRTNAYSYDPSGSMTCHVVRCGEQVEVTRFEYDPMGRLLATVFPDGGRVEQTYTVRGELLAQSGARTYPVAYTYTDRGQTATLSTYRNGVTGAADVTTWEYDAATGMLVSKRYADGSRVSYDYEVNGAVRTRSWARGVETRYAYDAAGAVTNLTYSDGTAAVRYEWDRQGRNTAVVDAWGRLEMTYSPDGRLLTTTRPDDPRSGIHYTFDPLGRVATIGMPYTSMAQAYDYDDAGRLATVSDGDTDFTYSYGADGGSLTRLTAVSSGANVLTSRREFDGLGRLIWTGAEVAAVATSHAYTYNAAGQRTKQALTDGSYWEYAYDDLGQLASGKKHFSDGIPVYGAQYEYEYDSIGNRRSCANVHGPATRRTTYACNALNQCLAVSNACQVPVTGTAPEDAQVWVSMSGQDRARLANRHGSYFWSFMETGDATIPSLATNTVRACAVRVQTGATNCLVARETRSRLIRPAVQAFAYDADGNLVSDGVYTNTWDAENRLVKSETISSVPDAAKVKVENLYDYMGRRVRKTVSNGYSGGTYNTTNVTTYVWDGFNIIAEMSDAGYTNWYTYGLDLSGTLQGAGGVGGLLSMTQHSSLSPQPSTYLYCFDGNGNVVNLVNATDGSIAATYEYSPFGQPLRATGPMANANPVRWSTKHTDDETGLVMYPKRLYEPTFGRWLSRDIIGENGGVNLYGFVQNNPVLYIDPLGLALYAFDGTWNDRDKMKRPTNVAKLVSIYDGLVHYEKGVGTDWYTKHVGGATGAGGKNRIESMYEKLVEFYNTPDPTGENQQIDIIGFSRGAALARAFVNYINEKGGVVLLGADGLPSGVVCPVEIRFLGLFDTVGSFGLAGNRVNIGYDLSIPSNVRTVRHAIAADEERGTFPLSSVLSGPDALKTRRIVEHSFRGAHSDIGGGYEDGDRSNFALMWMRYEGASVGVPFGELLPEDIGARNPIIHDERNWWARWRDNPREVYYH